MGVGHKTVRIKDVAEAAGVSVATVSRVLNGHDVVSDELRDKVLQAVEELDYAPSSIAQGLRLRQSKLLALVLPGLEGPFFPLIIAGVEEVARERGFFLSVCGTKEDSTVEREYLENMRFRWIDGIIMSGVKGDDTNRRLLQQLARRIPLVFVDREIRGVDAGSVTIDQFNAAYKATSYLVEKGHRLVAHIAGPLDRTLSRQRLDGYLQALADFGIEYESPMWVEADFGVGGGERAMRQLLASDARPTAVFAANDEMALGALRAAKGEGLTVPDDLAVVGFDDVPIAAMTDPPLTTVCQPIRTMGREAAKMLLMRIEDDDTSYRRLVLDADLVIRGSA